MNYSFPTQFDDSENAPKYLLDHLNKDGTISISIAFDQTNVSLFSIIVTIFILLCFTQICVEINVDCMIRPDELMSQTIQQLYEDPKFHDVYAKLFDSCDTDQAYYNASYQRDSGSSVVNYTSYILKINGCLEYLLGNRTLIQYKVCWSTQF